MRNAFARELTRLAQVDERIVLLSGDIGNRLFDDYKRCCPERFLNCGVAEANMMGMAAGLAMSGMRPVVYTITPFVTTRCLEQIRVDVCYHHVPVVIVGVGAGLSYASLGATHHACEDIAFLRAIPTMQVVCPGDARETEAALAAALRQDDPLYLRLGKKGEPLVHDALPEFEIGRAIPLRSGSDAMLLSTGNMLPVAMEAAELLEQAGVSAGVVSFHTVKPLDEGCLQDAFARAAVVVTIEEHSVIGGLGGAVAQWRAARRDAQAQLLTIGTPDTFLHTAGDQAYARKQFGLEAAEIAQRIANTVQAAAG